MTAAEMLKRTPLHPLYARYGARTVGFAGWELPVQFGGILEEHAAVRERAGLFDVSHMGRIELSGPHAAEAVQRLVTNDVDRLEPGRAMYALMCNEQGGIVDDLIVYRTAPHRFLLVVNAANAEKDLAHMRRVLAGWTGVEVRDRSADYALLALQGPRAAEILARVAEPADAVGSLRPFQLREGVRIAGIPCSVARTGYTGEDGFEIFCPPGEAPDLWESLMEAGRPDGLVPAGLGARDTLRFEASFPLYGNELTEETNPLEVGLDRFVKLEKDFVGRPALLAVRERGPGRRLVGLELLERGIARHGYEVTDGRGRVVGHVTSGTQAPTLGKSLAMALVPANLAAAGTELGVVVHGRERRARVVDLPFYRRPRARPGGGSP